LDLGKQPEGRFFRETIVLSDQVVTQEDILFIIQHLGDFDRDNRAGIEGTLHRISGIRNRKDEIIGLTCRVGKAVMGTIELVIDIIQSGKNILLLGKPGVGKTTLLRESARVLSVESKKRVVIVDTSNEIAGEGNLPHPAVGQSRRMQVPFNRAQHQVMIEAVENHMPEVIIIDEIGTNEEAVASRTIAERGAQLIATAHGYTLENILFNPTISDLVGGITAVILSDEESIRRGTQKTVLERTTAPTFDVLIEIHDRENFACYLDVSKAVDRYLRGYPLSPEIRRKDENGCPQVIKQEKLERNNLNLSNQTLDDFREAKEEDRLTKTTNTPKMVTRLYPFGISNTYLSRSLHLAKQNIEIVKTLNEANIVLTTEVYRKKNPAALGAAEKMNMPIYSIQSNSLAEVKRFISSFNNSKNKEGVTNLSNVERLIEQVFFTHLPVNLPPTDVKIRKIEHQIAARYGLHSESFGDEPRRFVVVYPPNHKEES
jgi:stage III sporulation protein SpoIIIAA